MNKLSCGHKTDCLRQRVINCARNRVGVTKYEFLSERGNLPDTANCYTFVWWVMNRCGIYFPRFLSDQAEAGVLIVSEDNWQPADIVFTKGLNGQVYSCKVGHVGILTGDTVIHACSKQRFVVESLRRSFLLKHELVMVRRAYMSCL